MSTIDHDNNFDLIRLIAASQVIYIHTIDWLNVPQLQAIMGLVTIFSGVPIFFIVSGFLVTQSLVKNDGRVVRYAINRALRIYPGLWTNFLFILVLLALTGSMTQDMLSPAFFEYQAGQFVFGSELYGYLCSGFSYNFSPGHFFHVAYPSGVLWTINVELGFYVLVPLLFTRYIRQRRWLLNTMLVTAAAGSIWASSIKAHLLKVDGSALSTYLLAYGPLPFLWVFLLGASAYLNWDRVRPWIVGRFGTWLSAYLLLTLIDIYGFGAPTVDLMKVTPLVVMKTILLAGTVLSFAYSFRRLSSVLKGIDLSYGLYLYHMPLIFVLLGFGFRESVWLWPVVYASTAGVAGLSWFLVERPTLALKARWRLRGASSVSSAGEGAGAPLKGVR